MGEHANKDESGHVWDVHERYQVLTYSQLMVNTTNYGFQLRDYMTSYGMNH